MPSYLIAFAAALVLLNLLVAAGLLWLCARIFKVAGLTIGRSLFIVVVLTILQLLLVALSFTGLDLWPALVAGLIGLVIGQVLAWLLIKKLGKVGWGRSALTWLVWQVLGAGFGVAIVQLCSMTLTEGYMMPSGAMATTVLGYHKTATCPECGHVFAVNVSQEVEDRLTVEECTCPNCMASVSLAAVAAEPGDSILACKVGYGSLQRQQLAVFEFPVTAGKGKKIIYAKRVIGLPGETIAIQGGRFFVYRKPRQVPAPAQLWATSLQEVYAWPPDEEAQGLFKAGQFEIVRRSPEQLLALARLVYDNDCQAKDLLAAGEPQRWSGAGWDLTDVRRPRHAGASAMAWLRYQHLLRLENEPGVLARQRLISDFEGYNTSRPAPVGGSQPNWVGDLLLECTLEVGDGADGECILELHKGAGRYQARFELATGACKLVRFGPLGEVILGNAITDVRSGSTCHVRLANCDNRLTVWVNGSLPFGDGLEYHAPETAVPSRRDLRPAAIGIRGTALTVSHLKLWRQTYYTTPAEGPAIPPEAWYHAANPAWLELLQQPPLIMYVQPGHYLMLGDNSPMSSDSRSWGLVPERLIQGPAVFIYRPMSRMRLLH